jgi:hypothetical protein
LAEVVVKGKPPRLFAAKEHYLQYKLPGSPDR